MKYLRQLAILFAFCIVGDILSMVLQGRLPGNVLGMTLLFFLLAAGVVRLSHIENVADFFLSNMAFFFIPACLGILDVLPLIKSEILPILGVILISTLLTAAAAGLTVRCVLRLQAHTALKRRRQQAHNKGASVR